MRADVLRRGGQFVKLTEEYKYKHFENDLLNTICRYQLHLAEESDDRWYTVKDAIEYFGGQV